MKALEEDVGCRLLDRVGKKVLLTQAGEQFFQRVDKIFGEMILARAELDRCWLPHRSVNAPRAAVAPVCSCDRFHRCG